MAMKNADKENRARDTGLAMVMLILLIVYSGKYYQLVGLAIVFLFISMVWPSVFGPLSGIWFGLSRILGTIMSKLILTAVFFVVVTPVGILRKLAGADPMQLKKWKKDESSVFKIRNHNITAKDLERPY
jgi:polyferredoxin